MVGSSPAEAGVRLLALGLLSGSEIPSVAGDAKEVAAVVERLVQEPGAVGQHGAVLQGHGVQGEEGHQSDEPGPGRREGGNDRRHGLHGDLVSSIAHGPDRTKRPGRGVRPAAT